MLDVASAAILTLLGVSGGKVVTVAITPKNLTCVCFVLVLTYYSMRQVVRRRRSRRLLFLFIFTYLYNNTHDKKNRRRKKKKN